MKHCCKKDFIFVLALREMYGKKMDILIGNAMASTRTTCTVAGSRL